VGPRLHVADEPPEALPLPPPSLSIGLKANRDLPDFENEVSPQPNFAINATSFSVGHAPLKPSTSEEGAVPRRRH